MSFSKHHIDRCGKSGSVAKDASNESFLAKLDTFATLATRLDSLDVAPITLECHTCHTCHIHKQHEASNSSQYQQSNSLNSLFDWLNIMLNEGHMEPSQPSVGRFVGWPKRSLPCVSLWVDFKAWAKKMRLPWGDTPDELAFHEILSQIFIPAGDRYEFPPLETCRETFRLLKEKYERT